jgi:nucleoside-diphosphate-sugar epimerase
MCRRLDTAAWRADARRTTVRVIVTGGAGYVGCRLVPALVQMGAAVRVVDKLVFGEEGLRHCGDSVELLRTDVRSLNLDDLRGFDAILHLAGLSNDPTAEFNPDANREINFHATVGLAQLARQAGVRRFVFASSCSVYYTEVPDDGYRDETAAVDPQAPYSWSKRQAEIALLRLASADFCPIVLRKGTVFGASPRMRFDLVVNTFTKDAYTRRRLTVHSGGRMWRPLLHIGDAVQTYQRVLAADEDVVRGQIFNVVSHNCQVLTAALEVKRALEARTGSGLELNVQPVGVSRSYRVDGRKLQHVLGLRLAGGIQDAVHEMWDAMPAITDPESPIYCNISWLELLSNMECRLRRMGGSPF